MNTLLKSSAAVGLAIVSLTTSCKKTTPSPMTPSGCITTIYGFTAPSNGDTVCFPGTINGSTAAISTSGTFISTIYTRQAAYNEGDFCYYAFSGHFVGSNSYVPWPLYKITASGSTVALSYTGSDSILTGLVYNRHTNKMYSMTDAHLVELTISGTSFSTTNLSTPVHPTRNDRVYITADPQTGDMYYVSGNPGTYYVEKYHAGSTSPTVVASGTGDWEILGLRYNINDSMLYAVWVSGSSATYNLIKINPATGNITTLTTLPSQVNVDMFSACIDPCNNRYIYSTTLSNSLADSGVLDQYSTTGTLLQHNVTPTFYQGLDAKQVSY